MNEQESPRDAMLVPMPTPALVHAVMKTELKGNRAARYLARWMLASAVLLTGLLLFSLIMGFWYAAIVAAVCAGVLYLEQYVTRWGNRGAQNRYHSNHSLLCALRVREEEEDGIRRYIEQHGPVADAPAEHAEEYTRLALQEGACIRYRQHLQERMAELRGEESRCQEDGLTETSSHELHCTTKGLIPSLSKLPEVVRCPPDHTESDTHE